MKTIEFMGVRYRVEDWVNWAALDADESVHGYESEPMIVQCGCCGYYFTNKMGNKTSMIGTYPVEKLAIKV